MTGTKLPLTLVVMAVFIVSCNNFANVIAAAELAGSGYGGYGPPAPHMSHLIQELRQHIQGLQINPFFTTDRNLERILIETRYRVWLAAKRLRRTASFRTRHQADHLLDWTPSEHFTSNLPYECSGYAKDGSPVFLLPFGKWNTPRLFRLARKREFYNYYLRMLEDARHHTKGRTNPKTGEPVDQAVFIVDAKGYGLRKLLTLRATWTLMRIAYTIDRHYPFLVQNWYVVNAPLAFQSFYKLIRLASSPTLERAVKIFSAFTNSGINALAHNIPRDAIPVSLGGSYVPKYELHATTATPLLTSFAAALAHKTSGWPTTQALDTPWQEEKSEGYVSPVEKCVTCTSTSHGSSHSVLKPPSQYGLKLSDQYGSPSVKSSSQYDSAPVKPSIQYESPSVKTSSQYESPSAKTSSQYESPSVKTSSQYESPSAKTSSQYESPSAKTSSQYGSPSVKTSPEYGPPQEKFSPQYTFPSTKAFTQYGSPAAKASVQYGPPLETERSQYEPQLEKTPAQYTLPLTKTSHQYGPPTPKASAQYSPPPAKTSSHYGTPSAVATPGVEYNAPSISAQDDTESTIVSPDFEDDPPLSLDLDENILPQPQPQYGSPETLQPQIPQLSRAWEYALKQYADELEQTWEEIMEF